MKQKWYNKYAKQNQIFASLLVCAFLFLIKMQMLSFARTYGLAKGFCLATIKSYAFFVRVASTMRTFLFLGGKNNEENFSDYFNVSYDSKHLCIV